MHVQLSWALLLSSNLIHLGRLVRSDSSQVSVDDCGLEFQGMYTDCRRVTATLPTSDRSVDAIQNLLSDSLTAFTHVIVVNYSHSIPLLEIGAMSDYYLQSRPYWTVFREDYPWQDHRTNSLIYIRLSHVDRPLIKIAEVMNPVNCSQRLLVFRGYHDFDQYGNEHSNLASYADRFLGTIPVVHIRDVAKFIDDGYCPNQINKHDCAFLPMTNCSLPRRYLECKRNDRSCTPGHMVYSSATPDAEIIYENSEKSDIHSKFKRAYFEPFSMIGDFVRSTELFDFEHVSREKYAMNGVGTLYFTAVFFRRNYDFRSRTAEMIRAFRKSTNPPFSPNKQCVGIHIRRHDRNKPGVDMLKFCHEIVRDSTGRICHNRTTGEPIIDDCRRGYDNYACASAAPFGAITMDSYLKAAELLLNDANDGRKTAFIITDDGAWVEEEIKRFTADWDIHLFPAQPNHRSRATVNGVTLFASIELMQQCGGLVGHTVSAFTVLLRAIMCVRHGPINDMRFGHCPKFFDFRSLAH